MTMRLAGAALLTVLALGARPAAAAAGSGAAGAGSAAAGAGDGGSAGAGAGSAGAGAVGAGATGAGAAGAGAGAPGASSGAPAAGGGASGARGGRTASPGDEFFIVSSVDAARGRIVLKRPTEVTLVMHVTARTAYRDEHGRRLRLADLRAGDTAYISFARDPAGEATAALVRLGPMTVQELHRRYPVGGPP